MSARRLVLSAVVFAACSGAAFAQSVISAHSGTLHYFDGAVTINDKAVEQHPGKFPEVANDSVLRTTRGRAEILLTPGVFLRIGENSAIKVLDNRLLSTRIEFLEGSAMIESDSVDTGTKDPVVTIIYKGYEIQPVKFGLFEITTSPEQLRVYKGQTSVVAAGNRTIVKDGHQMPFSAALLSEKFDEKNVDDLYLWTRDRSSNLSAANMASARTVANQSMLGGNGFSGNGLGRYGSGMGLGTNGWYYNAYLGMYTYLPANGTAWSPFGYGYFSPYSIYSYYQPNQYYWTGGGSARNGASTGVPLTNIGTSGVAASQVARLGNGLNTHPTLSSPVRTLQSPAPTAGFRGMDSGGGSGNFNGGVMYGGQSSGAGRGFDTSATNGRFSSSSGSAPTMSAAPAPSAPASAPAAAAGPGGTRGR